MPANKTILWLFYSVIALLIISLPYSKYVMSVSQFMLVGIFVIDGVRKETFDRFLRSRSLPSLLLLFLPNALTWIAGALVRKFRAFFHRENAPAWIFASIYLIHLLGLIHTTDFHYAMKDLRIKFPIFLLPLLLSTTGNVDRKAFRILTLLFIGSVLTGTLISLFVYLGNVASDSRQISIFISHIRFSLLIDMAIFQAFYLVLKKDGEPGWLKGILLLAGLWMIAFLVIFAFMTGIVILLATAAILVIYLAMSRPGWLLKVSTLALVTAGVVVSGYFLLKIWGDVARAETVDYNTLEKSTSQGNPYWHDTTSAQVENGHYVWIYISTDELREAWNRRSSIGFDGKDKAGQDLRYTLIRFLASKGYRKDADGVEKLTEEEVAMVENGIASVVYTQKSPLYVRIYKTFWEFQQYRINRNASGHSVMQRIEYWRTAAAIAKDHQSWWFGIGTGDLDDAFQLQYEKMGSMLEKEFRWRTHNQFLAIFVTFGITGLLWFLFALIFPGLRLRKFSDYFYLTFFIIFMLSMVTEDTLETQAGVTQFAFFTSFYLFSRKFMNHV